MKHLRKMGIDKYHQIELEKANPNIQRERRPAKHSANNTVCWTKCLGVYQRQCYSWHRVICAGESIPPTSINLDWFKINVKLSAEFQSDILGTLRYDIIGREVWSDNWILIIIVSCIKKWKEKLTKHTGYDLVKLLNSSSIWVCKSCSSRFVLNK